jgi:hypothetical protein
MPSSPPLAPPGAGLPQPELLVGRLLFRSFRLRNSRESLTWQFEREHARILELVRNCHPDDAARPVLIQRLAGMEDSSRNWSMFMTLEHLRIVNGAVAQAIRLLAAGKTPPNAASTAAVKPPPGVGPETIDAFHAGCQNYLVTVEEIPHLKTAMRYAHPWFGPLDAAGWHAMAAFHMALHRRQIEKIVESLDRQS